MRVAPVAIASWLRSVLTFLPGALLHPHARAARAAAHALGAVARHLDEVDAGERADDAPRREVHVVVAAEVAGVVVGDALLERRAGEREAAVAHELVEELAVVHHLVVAAELRVVVLDHVEAVGALRDDLRDAHRVERLDVLHGEHLEDVLVARAAGLVAVAELARPEDREVDARPLEQLGQRPARLLVAIVEAARATDEVQVLVPERRAGLDDVDAFEVLGPVAAVALVEAVGVAGVLHRPVGVPELGGEVALHQREVAAHVEDLVEDLDVDRTDLVAGLTARARPDLLGRDAVEHACRR